MEVKAATQLRSGMLMVSSGIVQPGALRLWLRGQPDHVPGFTDGEYQVRSIVRFLLEDFERGGMSREALSQRLGWLLAGLGQPVGPELMCLEYWPLTSAFDNKFDSEENQKKD